MKRPCRTALILCFTMATAPAIAEPGRDAILTALATEAKTTDASFAGFSAEAGKSFWLARHTGGKPDTPSCTSCHTKDPKAAGQTRAGKAIDPMAVSVNPQRFTDAEKVAKWFTRNCNTVLGRECTQREKGDVITFLMNQ
jgi:Domain of unknown function (DUF1924)